MKAHFGNRVGWLIYDIIKREFFDFIRQRAESFDWKGDFREQFDELFDEVLEQWKLLERRLGESKRLNGILYEILFYLMAVNKFEAVSKASWIDKFLRNKEGMRDDEEPPFYSIIPLYEPIAGIFYVGKDKKVPQIRADFLILSIINRRRYDPVLIDVKSSENAYKNSLEKEEFKWTKTACEWHNCWFYIAYPKLEKPKKANDWEFINIVTPKNAP